jgi:hypothetical protein
MVIGSQRAMKVQESSWERVKGIMRGGIVKTGLRDG